MRLPIANPKEMLVKRFARLCCPLMATFFLCHMAMADGPQPRAERFPEGQPGTRFSYADGVFSLKCNRWKVKEVRKDGEIVSKCGDNTIVVTDDGNPVMAVNDKGEAVSKLTPFLPQLSFPCSLAGRTLETMARRHELRSGCV